MVYVAPNCRGKDASHVMYSCRCLLPGQCPCPLASFQELKFVFEELLAQPRFQMIPIEFLPHCQAVPLGVMVRGIMESLLDAEALGRASPGRRVPEQFTALTIIHWVHLLVQVSAGQRASVFAASHRRLKSRRNRRSPPVIKHSTANWHG